MRLPAATISLSAGLLLLAETARAYIPAVPTNDTSSLDNSEDLLHLAFSAGVYNAKISRQLWQESFDDDGNYSNVSSVVPWTKYNKGVLIHFDESLRTQPPASVPWIAMISCDTNGTSFSDTDDIFTICRDLGAQAALLYSLGSQGCQITNEYLTSFEKVLDVFATTTLQAARIMEQQFVNVNSAAYQYDSATLNNSATIIQTLLDSNALSVNGNVPINSTSSTDLAGLASTVNPTLMTVDGAVDSSPTSPSVFDPDSNSSDGGESASTTPSPTAPSLFSNFAPAPDRFLHRRQQATPSSTSTESSLAGSATRSSVVPSATSTARGTTNYLGAVMAAGNLTVGGLLSSSPSPSASSGGGGDGGRSTGLAMIILYAITGVVCLLFLIVILSGAIRALRHPERYGPRAVNGAHGAGGLGGGGQTRAAGLTRAILDTFPVVRFGGDGAAARREGVDEEAAVAGGGAGGAAKDSVEGEEVELATLPAAPAVPLVAPVVRRRSTAEEEGEEIEAVGLGAGAGGGARRRSTSRSSFGRESFHSAVEQPLNRQASVASLGPLTATPQHVLTSSTDDASSPTSSSPASSPLSPPSPPRSPTHLFTTSSSLPPPVPTAVAATAGAGAGAGEEEEGESCPICFTEFEAGDELRVLPCDQRHIFHTGCIDPWLLEVSSSCPLCRLDLASTSAPPATTTSSSSDPSTTTTAETDATAARHEEERVIRHLRALLHRGAQVASAAGAASGMGGGAVGVPSGSGLVVRPGGAATAAAPVAGAGEDEGQARLRGRFARYVAQRRERVRVAGVGVGVGRRRRNTTTAMAGSEAERVPA